MQTQSRTQDQENNNPKRIPPRQNTIIVSDCWPPITETFDESSAGRIGATHLIHGASTVDRYLINKRQNRDEPLCRSRRALELDGLTSFSPSWTGIASPRGCEALRKVRGSC